MTTTKRLSSKQPTLRPLKGPRSSGLRGGGYSAPKVNKDRHLPTQVVAFEEGHHGKQQKRRPKWPY